MSDRTPDETTGVPAAVGDPILKPDPCEKEPTTYQRCDVVMKGGITSGVLYPTAIHAVSKKFRFCSIGGASAGAIVAAATAAAEYGRRKEWKTANWTPDSPEPPPMESNAFDLLNSLADDLTPSTDGSRHFPLVQLFTPVPKARAAMKTFLATMSSKDTEPPPPPTSPVEAANLSQLRLENNAPKPKSEMFMTFMRLLWGVACNYTILVVIALLIPALLLRWYTEVSPMPVGLGEWVLFGLVSVLVVLLSLLLLVVLPILWGLVRVLKHNDYGMCTGHNEGYSIPLPEESSGSVEPYLTDWLEHKLCKIAGILGRVDPRTGKQRTLTFRALKGRGIDLKIVTTNLTQGRPNCIPFLYNEYYFDPDEMRRLFPPHVVDWMVAHQRQSAEPVLNREGRVVLPLPLADDLPVIVAVRMSMAFPIVLSTVPLYAVDYKYLHNAKYKDTAATRIATRCNFSDGGICNNMPIQFFDDFLPDRPTFGFNFTDFHPDKPRHPTDESKNVWMVQANAFPGLANTWSDFRTDNAYKNLIGFIFKIIGAARNWADNSQLRLPGYRERVVNIGMDSNEGGLNLKMPKHVIERLKQRGEEAGTLLVRRYANGNDGSHSNGWTIHRWVRFRTIMAQMEWLMENAQCMESSPDGNGPSYLEILQGSLGNSGTPEAELIAQLASQVDLITDGNGGGEAAAPMPYKFRSQTSLNRAVEEVNLLLGAAIAWSSDGETPFDENRPRPHSTLQNRADF